jgi:hypothetical protein
MPADGSFTAGFTPGLQLGNTDGDTFNNLIKTVNGGNSAISGLIATGTTRADALQIAKRDNNFTSVGSGTGALLPNTSANFNGPLGEVAIFNGGASTLTVYADGASTIDGSAGSSGVPLSAAARAKFYAVTSGGWISALLGAKSA